MRSAMPAVSALMATFERMPTSADLAAVYDQMSTEWQHRALLHWLGRESFTSVLETAVAGLQGTPTGAIAIEPIHAENRMLFRASAPGCVSGYALAWKDDVLEVSWAGETSRQTMPAGNIVTPDCWAVLPADLQADLAEQGWTSEKFNELADDALYNAGQQAGFYGIARVTVEAFRSEHPRTKGQVRVVFTADVEGDVNDDLARFDPSDARTAVVPGEVSHA